MEEREGEGKREREGVEEEEEVKVEEEVEGVASSNRMQEHTLE